MAVDDYRAKARRAKQEAMRDHERSNGQGREPEHPGDGDPALDPPEARGGPASQFVEGDAYEGRAAEGDTRPSRFRFRTSAEFLSGNYQLSWLVKGLLVEGQPGVLGGPKKALKTSLVVDAALSLGTGTPFLGRFAVPKARRVGIMSGESGEATLRDTAIRVAEAKGIDPKAADVLWEFQLPRLADPGDLAALGRALREEKVEVLFIDPLYLCVLAGAVMPAIQTSNVFQMGPLFLGVARACLDVGCTPIPAHHFKLTRANPYDEPQLEDLAFAGIQEFARQWLLVGRRERYDPGTGLHELWLSAGGSAGQSGLWALDIDEGVIDDDFRGRRWEVSFQNPTEARQGKGAQKEEEKKAKKRKAEADEEARFMGELDRLDPEKRGAGLRQVRDAAGMSGDKVGRVVQRLVAAGLLVEIGSLKIPIGSNASRTVEGVRRAPESREQ